MGDKDAPDGDMAAASKVETAAEATPSSLESTPEQEAGVEPTQEPAQPQKRKGGRKPIYATSEERKQRNRQAQAAFRERRTEYIKQLEATIKQNEDTLANLQQSHRTAADECLMLRYKNSLLERILLEKGIDVQAELQMKTGSPVVGHGFMQPVTGVSQPSQLQRTALQRQQARRSGSQNFLPKLAPGQPNPDLSFSANSPHAHPTPSSHASSPSQMSMRSPMNMQQGGMTPPTSAVNAQPQAQHFQTLGARTSQHQPSSAYYQAQQPSHIQRATHRATPSTYRGSASGASSVSGGSLPNMSQAMSATATGATAPQSASTFFPGPFQKHYDQLDQEYDTQHSQSILEEPEQDGPAPERSPRLHGSYPPQYNHAQGQQGVEYFHSSQDMQAGAQQQLQQQAQFGQPHMPSNQTGGSDGQYDVDPSDPMLDADPFGLSASMHYPTNYSFDQHQSQR
ncbi:hypothetical protein DOTSEDRAFT_68942 [Lecanosticta acicola]|uniref:BZIP domain-containing protein n=1 Tax=Lecanosticta acicola TaxID=111012 RepID=A0AAI8Z081_9PEZI|nr:hypothetical protein DOTSEDRAFT_68942 [Lecanosticta acicola]